MVAAEVFIAETGVAFPDADVAGPRLEAGVPEPILESRDAAMPLARFCATADAFELDVDKIGTCWPLDALIDWIRVWRFSFHVAYA